MAAALEVADLHKRFGGLEVLQGVDLTAAPGDVIAVIGGSGSGKSTLLRCINLLELPDAGSIRVDGEALRLEQRRDGSLYPADRNQITRLRAQLGFVFQNFNLWPHMRILRNVTEGPIHVLGLSKAEAIERAENVLAKVGLADKRDAWPNHLSGGQQQRAAIARALAMEPRVMLFDEPTSALDPELVGEVLGVIRGLAEEGRTMVIVTHEMRFARDVCSEVVFLDAGRVAERGPPARVFTEPDSARLRQFLARYLEVPGAHPAAAEA